MFKQILLSAAALSAMAITTSQAEAHYGYGYGHPHYSSYSYSYQPSCYTEQRPVTFRVWDDYACEYVLRTVYRDYQVCN